jgi:hypothetical protein
MPTASLPTDEKRVVVLIQNLLHFVSDTCYRDRKVAKTKTSAREYLALHVHQWICVVCFPSHLADLSVHHPTLVKRPLSNKSKTYP